MMGKTKIPMKYKYKKKYKYKYKLALTLQLADDDGVNKTNSAIIGPN